MNSNSGLSIIIPTEGRVHLTIQLIETLYELCVRADFKTEVIIIDSSEKNDRTQIANACSQFNVNLISGPASVRKKRNLGIMESTYSVILFLDSDCTPTEDLLQQHWKCYQKIEGSNLGGVLGRLKFTGPESLAWKFVQNSSLVQQFNIATTNKSVSWGPTANLSVRRDVLHEIGLFDETFPFKLGGDDLDLTYRLTKSGWLLACNPDAIAYHTRDTWNSLALVLSRALRWGRMEYHLYKKHASLRMHHPPTILGWLLLIIFFSLIQSLIFNAPVLLLMPLVWFLLAIFFFSLLASLTSPKNKLKAFVESLLTAVPELMYQFGSTFEFLRHADIRFFYSRPLLSSNGVKGSWNPEAWNTWSNLLALLVHYSLVLFWVSQR